MTKVVYATAEATPATDTPIFFIDGTDVCVIVHAEVRTGEQAKTIAAQFPKSLGVRGYAMGRYEEGENVTTGWIEFRVKLSADKTNGGRNESGIRKYRSVRKHLDRLGCPVQWTPTFSNSYATEADFEATIA